MQRSLFSIRLEPGTEDEYDRRHAQVWPEMVDAMHACGITNSTGFRRGTEVFYYAECDPDPLTCYGRLEHMEVNQRWSEHFRGIVSERLTEGGSFPFLQVVSHVD
ncbi:MAG: L-rhamnose mutarotase [Candidatus Limnocylindrales bacterium]